MKLLQVILCWLVAAAGAYQVHEDFEEDDEISRGKRQESGGAYIDSIFNIPITAIKQTSAAAQTLSPGNAAAIDSVLKIPVTTLQAVSALIKSRQQASTTTARPIRRQDDALVVEHRAELKRRMDAQRDRQRVWEEQVHRRRMDQLQRYNRRMQQRILEEDERAHFHKEPFGFTAFTRWISGGSHRVFGAPHAGHGDGHVYQYYNRDKPMFLGGRPQGTEQPEPALPTQASPSSTTASPAPAQVHHVYAVQEVIDEGSNQFDWPNWFGIINVLRKSKVEPPVQNKLAHEDFKHKYAEARKNDRASEREVTGNELDADVAEAGSREARVLFPTTD